jgi:hypothetical protein
MHRPHATLTPSRLTLFTANMILANTLEVAASTNA